MAQAAPWHARLTGGGLKVGLMLAGRKTWKAHYDRAVPSDALTALAGVPGIALHSLQKDPPLTPSGGAITDLAPELVDFADTAAAITALDLVISVDTAVVHLAGALGKPVWIMLPRFADWRWLVERADGPWYPTARLFRQTTPDD
ncbi:MAG: glycosyltransferase family 9 protein [Stellaceae bacterium]